MIPQAVYGCANEGCAAETSYPPSLLFWAIDGWYCDGCVVRYSVGGR